MTRYEVGAAAVAALLLTGAPAAAATFDFEGGRGAGYITGSCS